MVLQYRVWGVLSLKMKLFKLLLDSHVFIFCILKLENSFSQFGLLYEVVILDAVHQQQEEV